jgi:hypothetical protein
VKICARTRRLLCAPEPNEAAREAASVASGIVAIEIHRELDGPEPPHDPLAPHISSGHVHETDIAPALARTLVPVERRRRFELQTREPFRICRRGLHLLTPENTKKGACRACQNERERARRQVA